MIRPELLVQYLIRHHQVTFQRNTIDISGNGSITIGQLPEGVDNSSITWVPVRLYSPADGGQNAPTFAPNEQYPLYVPSRYAYLPCLISW